MVALPCVEFLQRAWRGSSSDRDEEEPLTSSDSHGNFSSPHSKIPQYVKDPFQLSLKTLRDVDPELATVLTGQQLDRAALEKFRARQLFQLDLMETVKNDCPERLSFVKRLMLSEEERAIYHMHVTTLDNMLAEFNSITRKARQQGLFT